MSPVKRTDSNLYPEHHSDTLMTNATGSSKIKRSEFTKSRINGNFSPIRHIGGSNNRLSFMS